MGKPLEPSVLMEKRRHGLNLLESQKKEKIIFIMEISFHLILFVLHKNKVWYKTCTY